MKLITSLALAFIVLQVVSMVQACCYTTYSDYDIPGHDIAFIPSLSNWQEVSYKLLISSLFFFTDTVANSSTKIDMLTYLFLIFFIPQFIFFFLLSL
jgi:hypothetical protein